MRIKNHFITIEKDSNASQKSFSSANQTSGISNKAKVQEMARPATYINFAAGADLIDYYHQSSDGEVNAITPKNVCGASPNNLNKNSLKKRLVVSKSLGGVSLQSAVASKDP